ncbi:MAG: polyhydroxyalkanoate synthesis regulator DNA-binding domain-containing protein [Desulfococcaceae bacterium]|jgi:hypothetical protein|nr:polyhydroxyalkanoate synthesis regulator DNA-binding domain-containing protein [Desulfococcaceae bacterium]
MLHIKRYANGKFFDTEAKEYVTPETLSEMMQKGEEIQVTLAKTGKDITDEVIARFSEKTGEKKSKKGISFIKTDKMLKWLGEIIDARIEKAVDLVKLPSREQVAELDRNIRELNEKIDALKLSWEKPAAEKPAAEKTDADIKAAGPKMAVSSATKTVGDPAGKEAKSETQTAGFSNAA